MGIFEDLAEAEEGIKHGHYWKSLEAIARARKAALDELADALCQGGDSRKVGDELQLGHFFTGTWEDIAWTLVEQGAYEWVDPEAKYWIRECVKTCENPEAK